MLSNSSNVNKNKQIHAFYKLLKLLQNNFNYPYLVLISKFHKKLVKFRTVTIGYYTHSNNASKFLLSILKQIYDLTINNNSYYLKNSYQLLESINKLKRITNTVT